jgi:hypothetical protein
VLGPVVEIVSVTVCTPVVPVAICVGLKAQLTVASGRPLQAKVIGKVVVPVGVTVKVVMVDWPAAAGAGAVGVVTVKAGLVTVTVAEMVVDDEA